MVPLQVLLMYGSVFMNFYLSRPLW